MKEVFLLEAFSPGRGKAALLWLSNTLTQTIHVKIVHFHWRAGSWSRRQSGFKAVGYCDDISSIASFALFCTRRSVDFFPQIMTSSRLKPDLCLGSPVLTTIQFCLGFSAAPTSLLFYSHFKYLADYTIVLGHQKNNGSGKGWHHSLLAAPRTKF